MTCSDGAESMSDRSFIFTHVCVRAPFAPSERDGCRLAFVAPRSVIGCTEPDAQIFY